MIFDKYLPVQSTHLVPIITITINTNRTDIYNSIPPEKTIRFDSNYISHTIGHIPQYCSTNIIQSEAIPTNLGTGISCVQCIKVLYLVPFHTEQLLHRLLHWYIIRLSNGH